jgi:hypothetical protein
MMRITIQFTIVPLLAVLLSGGMLRASEQSTEPDKFFREYVGLADDQIQSIRRGKAIAKVLDSRTPDEVFVFGAIYIDASPESYLKLAAVDALRKLPNFLAIQRFSEPPQLSDLDGFTLEEEDVKQLRNCKPGHCEIQLPAESMEEFQREVDWSGSDVTGQVNRAAQRMALESLARYQQQGNAALGTYRDKNHPVEVAETFQFLLSRSKALPVYLPDLDRYLLDYPGAKSRSIDSEFYWEKVNFGLKPTLRIVQAIVYRGTHSNEPAYAVAVKQLYSSHYFQSALDLTVCVKDPARPRGFYLITLKGSKQAGLTGLKGGIVRKVAVGKTTSSLERTLVSIKEKLETQTN